MNAGGILGLMAGLGAMSAMGKDRQGGTGQRFTGLMDMLDGGGAGQSGDRFEGGGLLSALGNLFMKPIAAQDNVERIARETNAAKSAAKGGFTPPVTHQDPYMEEARMRASALDAFGGPDLPYEKMDYGPQNGRGRPSFKPRSHQDPYMEESMDPYRIGSGGEYDGAIKKLPTPTRLEGGSDFDMRPPLGAPKHESAIFGENDSPFITNEDRDAEIYNIAVSLVKAQDPFFTRRSQEERTAAVKEMALVLMGKM